MSELKGTFPIPHTMKTEEIMVTTDGRTYKCTRTRYFCDACGKVFYEHRAPYSGHAYVAMGSHRHNCGDTIPDTIAGWRLPLAVTP